MSFLDFFAQSRKPHTIQLIEGENMTWMYGKPLCDKEQNIFIHVNILNLFLCNYAVLQIHTEIL